MKVIGSTCNNKHTTDHITIKQNSVIELANANISNMAPNKLLWTKSIQWSNRTCCKQYVNMKQSSLKSNSEIYSENE